MFVLRSVRDAEVRALTAERDAAVAECAALRRQLAASEARAVAAPEPAFSPRLVEAMQGAWAGLPDDVRRTARRAVLRKKADGWDDDRLYRYIVQGETGTVLTDEFGPLVVG